MSGWKSFSGCTFSSGPLGLEMVTILLDELECYCICFGAILLLTLECLFNLLRCVCGVCILRESVLGNRGGEGKRAQEENIEKINGWGGVGKIRL